MRIDIVISLYNDSNQNEWRPMWFRGQNNDFQKTPNSLQMAPMPYNHPILSICMTLNTMIN